MQKWVMRKCCSVGPAQLRHGVPLQRYAGSGSSEPLGGREGSESPSKEETGCMEEKVVRRKGGERAGS